MLPNPVYYESQCAKDYFYGEDKVLEKQLQNKEGEWSTAFRKIISQKDATKETISLLKEFVVYQRQRTSIESKKSKESKETLLREGAILANHKKRLGFDDEDIEKYCHKMVEEENTPAENVELASKIVKSIDDLDVLIVHYNTPNRLITSDAPVIALNAFSNLFSYGMENLGIAFFLPLSPEYLLIVYDSMLYKHNGNELFVESSNHEEVHIINKYELINAERFAYSVEPSELSINADILSKREREKKRNEPSIRGPEGNRIVISQTRGTDYYYEIPYLKLPREFRRIPVECRNPIPRFFDDGWADRLANNYAFVSEINKKIPYKGSLTNKKQKEGFERMEKAAHVYWQKKRREMENVSN